MFPKIAYDIFLKKEDNLKTFTVAKIRYPPHLNLQACYPVIKTFIALI